MKIPYITFTSFIHNKEMILSESNKFIKKIESLSKYELFEIEENEDYSNYPFVLAFIRSGGTEGLFKPFFLKNKDKRIYILSYNSNNSLAASMEILTYLRNNKYESEILHGDEKYINERLDYLVKINTSIGKFTNLGVIGKPSDWLISSDVDYDRCRELFGINLINIDIKELVDRINKEYSFSLDVVNPVEVLYKEKEDVIKANQVYKALLYIKKKYKLKGLSVRCFDLLTSVKSTSCLAFSKLNDDLITASCEGDLPALISMHLINSKLKLPVFQVNPSIINTKNNEMIFAHCTIPTKMCESYKLNTHFESGLGVAIKGELPLKEITIFKVSPDLTKYYCEKAEIIENLNEDTLCRTQIKIKLNSSPSYFLEKSLGNHHIIILGDQTRKINNLLKNKLERVR